MRWHLSSILTVCMASFPATALAAPHHDICSDLDGAVRFGVSSYGSLRDWAPEAKAQHGADFRLLYVYILAGGMDDPDNFKQWYVEPFLQTAVDMDAIPVLTFYQLLDLGKAAGFQGGHEADIVAQSLANPSIMHTYFDNYVWLLEIAATFPPPVVVHVEPDSWGFMMWAMGVEGNDDPTSIPVRVDASGHPDAAGFADNAAGLGQALVAMRDKHAPEVRLGWHASNFRVGTRPEVVVSFFSQMGDWDLLVGEYPHVDPNPASWWDSWEPAAVETNVTWLSTVTTGTGLPLLLWQTPIGATDWHLLGAPEAPDNLLQFAGAGVAGVLFEHIAFHNETDPDSIRADGDFGTPPPTGSPAGGTAADMRARVTGYSPLTFPLGSVCGSSGAGGGGSGAGGTAGSSGGASGAGGTGGSAGTPPSSPAASGDDAGGCACSMRDRSTSPAWLLALLAACALRRRRGFRASVPHRIRGAHQFGDCPQWIGPCSSAHSVPCPPGRTSR